MDLVQEISAEDVFIRVSDLVNGQQLTADAAMSLAAQALCLMAVAWRPRELGTLEANQLVMGLVEEWLRRMENHPFAAGQTAN